MSYMEEPMQILDRKKKQLRSKIISLVKVLWRNQHIEEAMRAGRGDAEELSTFVSRYVEFRGRNFYKEGRM